MYKVLPPGVKSSITRSISKVYESYMADIEWDEDRYDLSDFIKEWKGIGETQRELGISHISSACKGKRKSAGGFKWMYKEDYENSLK